MVRIVRIVRKGDIMGKKYTQSEYEESIKDSAVKSIGTYLGIKTPHPHQCKLCDYIWSPLPGSVRGGHGCPLCGKLKISKSKLIKQKDYIKSIEKSSVKLIGDYVGTSIPTPHQCKVCDHIWSPYPLHIKRGSACPKCWRLKTAYQKYKGYPTTLYLIDIIGVGIKPGVTKESVKRRYRTDNIKYKIIYEIPFNDGWDAWKLEQSILNSTIEGQIYRFNNIGPLIGGNTEIRNISVGDLIISFFEEYKDVK